MRRFILLPAALLAFASLTACDDPQLWDDLRDVSNTQSAERSGVELADIESVQFMREEEKLARDVYLQLSDAWGLNTHANIARSEQTHTDRMAALLAEWGALDPAEGLEIGEFRDPDLQQLHDDLMAMGLESPEAALRVGALVEEVDIIDLDERMAETELAVLDETYASLRAGSESHLRAFVGALAGQGVVYAPVQLDQASYDAIINAAGSNGGGGGRR